MLQYFTGRKKFQEPKSASGRTPTAWKLSHLRTKFWCPLGVEASLFIPISTDKRHEPRKQNVSTQPRTDFEWQSKTLFIRNHRSIKISYPMHMFHAWTYLFDQMWSLDHKSLISRATFIQHFFYQWLFRGLRNQKWTPSSSSISSTPINAQLIMSTKYVFFYSNTVLE